ncbi:MAG: YicC family protein [Lentimicrobiaceae bacterium]|nr:YicC family protein [Lentimicrobiaceae bacterium]
MIKSMTGFGTVSETFEKGNINVEIRCLNSKNLDLSTKLPSYLKEFEYEIRKVITDILVRGKIDLNISVEFNTVCNDFKIDTDTAKNYFSSIEQLCKELNLDVDSRIVPSLMKLPNVLVKNEEDEYLFDHDFIISVVDKAAKLADEYRIEEGKSIETDIVERIDNIGKYLLEVTPWEEERIKNIRNKFDEKIADLSFNENVTFDENRLEQEIFFYLEKLDISEEKTRLDQHLKYFTETLNLSESNGKKLNFITQEMGREINTLGSKANNIEIQKIVVCMKDELEKIKEQLGNVL